MRLLILLLTIIGLTPCVYGQEDHLEPAKDRSQYVGILKQYYEQVVPKLLTSIDEKSLARYLVMPSFSSEYVMSLEQSADKFILKLNSCSENYWYAKDRKKVRIISSEIELDADLANKLQDLFNLAVQTTKAPEKLSVGADGVVYTFSIYKQDTGIMTGEIWSPKSKSKMAELVRVSEMYKRYILTKGQKRNELITETDNLISRLKE